MTVATQPQVVTVNLTAACTRDHCLRMGWQLKRQLDPAYRSDASVLELDGMFTDYLAHRRTARKRAAHAKRLGYTFQPVERHAYEGDIHAINTSMPVRQGRPMAPGYHQKGAYGPNPVVCPRHHVYTYGVLQDDRLAAYLWLYRSGQLAMVSSILGHADHLENGVMYLLFLGMLERQFRHGGTAYYNRWSSGTDGLRFFKTRVGMEPGTVNWELL